MISISPDDPVFDAVESDPSVHPGEDFYQFANGGWLASNPVPPEYGAWGSAHEVHVRNEAILHDLLREAASADADAGSIQQMVGDYYTSGMDTETIDAVGLAPIEAWLERIDGIQSIHDIRNLTVEFHRIGVDVLFGTSVIPDFEAPDQHLLYLDQGGLGLPDRDYYLRDDEQSLALLSAYQDHIGRMLTLGGRDGSREAADVVLGIETEIARAQYTSVQMRDVDLITNKSTMDTAGMLMPRFGLDAYFVAIGAGDEASFNIDNVELYPALDAMLESSPLDDWKTYLSWHLLRATASSLPEALELEFFEFYGKTLGGQQKQKERWKRILAAGSADIGQLISQLYVADNFPPESKQRMEELVDNLLSAMEERLNAISWMSDATRSEALAKLAGFGYKIGYPDEWRDYSGLSLHPGTWLENRAAASRFEFARNLGKLGQSIDPHEWGMPPHIVNAYYHPLRNEIVFPAGMLQPPFFTADADDAVNYGAIGSVIGHEITHGFDDQGSKFDAVGQMRDWWDASDAAEFTERAGVVVEQFDAYEVEDGLHVNGELTLGENIADLGGLKVSLAAMALSQDGGSAETIGGLTPEQRFFISYARAWRQNYTEEYLRLLVNSDPHSPNHFRCNGPLSNLDAFASAFGIDDDAAAMRPISERADIW